MTMEIYPELVLQYKIDLTKHLFFFVFVFLLLM